MFSKGISPFIAFMLVVAISVAATVLVFRSWSGSYEKVEGYAMVTEAKGVLNSINSAIRVVAFEGEGSSRKLSFSVSGGEYRISSASDSVFFVMNSDQELFSPGTLTEGDLFMEFFDNHTVRIKLNYTSVDIATDERWSSGYHNFVVKNNGTSGGGPEILFSVL